MFVFSSIARYILLTSAIKAILWKRKRNSTSTNEEYTVGPTSRLSFNDTPVEVFAEVTARTFVVVLEDFITACIGK